jgi:hypothetical protein
MVLKFDPTTIKGPYPLLTIFLIAIEGILTLWLTLSNTSEERISVGIFMVVIFLAFLVVVVFIKRYDVSKYIAPTGSDEKISPAEDEVTQDEIESPEPQQIADPYRRYVINKPPENWTIKQINFNDWKYDSIGIRDPKIKEKLDKTELDEDLFVLSSDVFYKLIPKPGLTKINGRIYYTALELSLKIELGIISLPRFNPPFYTEHDFENNTLDAAGGLSAVGMMVLKNNKSGIIQKSNRRYRLYEFHQEVEHVLINDQEQQKVTIIIILMGIEGETRDHLLFMKYPFFDSDTQLHNEIKLLYDLVNSFQPLKTIDSKSELAATEKIISDQSAKTWKEFGKQQFEGEIAVVLLRLADKNLDDLDICSKLIKDLNNLKKLSISLNLDSEYSNLWNILNDAENGNIQQLKLEIKNWIKEFKEQQKE